MSSDLVNLEQVADVIDSLHKTPPYSRDGFPMVRVTDVKYGYLDLADCLRVPPETYEEFSRRYKPKINDIVITRVGSYGNTAIVKNPEFCLGQNTAAIIPKNINPRYLYAALNSPQVKAEIEAQIVGSTQKTLSLARIKGLNIPRHSPQVEEDIASTIGALDDRITLLRETNKTHESIAQAIFKSWFVDFDPVRAKMEGRQPEGMDEATAALFPDSFEESELGLVPKGWSPGTLGDIATFQNGYAFKSKDWTDSGYPVIKIGDVKPGIIDLNNCSFVSEGTVRGLERFQLRRGDLLVGMTGYVGETGLVPFAEPLPYLNQRVGRIVPKLKSNAHGYVYCAVRAAAFKEFAKSQSHGSAQANVSGASLLAYPTILGCGEVTSAFTMMMATVIEAILSNHELAETLANLRDTILPRLISGQLRLPEAQEKIANAV